jgi:hypothetical protein
MANATGGRDQRRRPMVTRLVAELDGLTIANPRKLLEATETRLEPKTEDEQRSFVEVVTARAKPAWQCRPGIYKGPAWRGLVELDTIPRWLPALEA